MTIPGPTDNRLIDKLVEAAEWGDTPRCLFLLSQGVDINGATQSDARPLLMAAIRKQHETAFALINHGADIHARNKSGDSILHNAAQWPLPEFTHLITLGADVNALNLCKTSPLHCVNDVHKAEALIRCGADVNAITSNGQTALHNAVFIRNWPLTELLVRLGANTNIRDASYRTPMAVLLHRSDWGGAALLVALGVQTRPSMGKNKEWRRMLAMPPLHAAASGGHVQLVLKIIADGGDPLYKFRRKTALKFAQLSRHFETIGLLQACEARAAIDQIMREEPPKITRTKKISTEFL